MISDKVSGIRLFGSLLILSLSVEGYAFGALFTSPQQRDALNQQRSQGTVFSPKPKPTLRQTPSASKEKQVFFNGYVTRTSGPSTAWANNKMLPNDRDKKTAQNGVSAKLDRIKGTSVPIKPSALSRSVRLQPGQSLNLATGKIAESYSQKQPIPAANNSKAVAFSDDSQSTETKQLAKEQTEKPENNTSEQE